MSGNHPARGRLLSRHLTSDGEVRYVACACGAIHVLLNGASCAATSARDTPEPTPRTAG